VALAGDEHDVAGLGLLHGPLDRRAPVELDLDVAPAPLEDLGDDRARILAAGVVRRDDHDVRELGCDPAHQRPLLPVAIAARAEDDEHAAVCQVARRPQDVRERLRLVRVVDEHAERLSLVHRLEPARHASDGLDARHDRIVLDAEEPGEDDGGQDVRDVERAAEVRPEVEPRDAEPRPVGGEVEPLRVMVRGGVEAVRRRGGELRREAPAPRVVDVDGGERRWVAPEQAALRVVVRLHRPVEVEVLVREVRERERAQSDVVEPAELRRVRRGLDHGAAVARLEHLPKQALEVDRLWCRARELATLSPDTRLHRADEAGPPARGVEDRVEDERRRRLPARARDPHDFELLRRAAEERVRGRRHRSPDVAHDQLGDGELERTGDDERRGAGSDRVGREVVAVARRARDAEEEAAGAGGAGVVGEV
jgi:hypothetical protein